MKEMMFCNQCQETTDGVACLKAGNCGKEPHTARLQDLLVEETCALALAARVSGALTLSAKKLADRAAENLFFTITNVNFDNRVLADAVRCTYAERLELQAAFSTPPAQLAFDPTAYLGENTPCPDVRPDAEENEDLRSLRQLVLYGLKGFAAYRYHAAVLGVTDNDADTFLLTALARLAAKEDDGAALTALALDTGAQGVAILALLDKANTEAYGTPEATVVQTGVRNNPGILISGHDLRDLEILLQQAEGTGVDVYTHSEMLAAHAYPAFRKYQCFAGNYGNAWWKQKEEFEDFNGPVILTTNCLMPVRDAYKARLFTTGPVGWEGCSHITEDENGSKDFSAVIEAAKQCQPPKPLENGTVMTGFAHGQVMALADKVVEAVKSGAVKKFVVMAGCDGKQKSRAYYSDFARALPEDTIVLTAGCAKYKVNKLDLGDIGGIPRVLDAGQCNDCYSLAVIALKLKEAFGLDDINDLPIVYNISWYEQKAVIVLLALLSLGVKNIHLGPTLPAFLSPGVAKVLVENFGIAGISTVQQDIITFFPPQKAA